jgi:hypothetical protein
MAQRGDIVAMLDLRTNVSRVMADLTKKFIGRLSLLEFLVLERLVDVNECGNAEKD